VHLITAEAGGDAAVITRLAERGCDVGSIPVHSDPEHELLVPPAEELYILKEKSASEFNKNETDTYTDYMMVQPAHIVLDTTGAVVQRWSWKTMEVEDPSEMTMIDNPDPEHPMKQIPMVTVRPVTADIALSLAEGRDIKLMTLMDKMGAAKQS